MTTTAHATPPTYLVGVDLAQASDYTAIAVLEHSPAPATGGERRYDLRHLERLQGVSYVAIAAHLRALVEKLRAPVGFEERLPRDEQGRETGFHTEQHPMIPDVTLVYDRTGVGAACADILAVAAIAAPLIGVLIHGGDRVTREHGVYRVPKRDLVSSLIVVFQGGQLKIAPALPLAKTLQAELQNFKLKLNPETMHDSYSAWREADHDDLVLATALAVWFGERQPPRAVPVASTPHVSRWSSWG